MFYSAVLDHDRRFALFFVVHGACGPVQEVVFRTDLDPDDPVMSCEEWGPESRSISLHRGR